MTYQLQYGSLNLAEGGRAQTHFLIHGGAGPQDPKGEAALRARAAIAKILDETVSKNQHPLPPPQPIPPLSQAERHTLTAACLLEDHPLFNAGFGAAIQADGQIRVSAAFMESTRQKLSAVINGQGLRHPSMLTHYLQEARFPVLDAGGTGALARDLGLPHDNLYVPERFSRWETQRRETLFGGQNPTGSSGTIGCVSCDSGGNLAVLTSTGGVGNETPGRVGDTPTVAGTYCSGHVAVSCTGYGEQILNQGFAVRLAVRAEDGGDLQAAFRKCLQEATERQYELAAIALYYNPLNKRLAWAAGTTETYFVWGAMLAGKRRCFQPPE